jgi:protein-L-isoaspartate(D-aspartate) O-methyltransferase
MGSALTCEIGGWLVGHRKAASGGAHQGSRQRMVARLEDSGIRDPRVLAALRSVPRHCLVPEALQHRAYDESALPIGERQTISAPLVVAVMTQALALLGDETVLEIGTGSAYQAAILSRLAERVISVERIPRLASRARSALDALGVSNVLVFLGDGSRGWRSEAPYDAIVVTAAALSVPEPLLDQLAPGGRLVGPFGERDEQVLLRITRRPDGEFEREQLGRCRFVDLVGEHGWVA